MMKVNTINGAKALGNLPDECPFCHKSVTPNVLHGHQHDNMLEVSMFCPHKKCQKSFIGYYRISATIWYFNGSTTTGTLLGKTFSDTIENISKSFTCIFNESYTAEQQGLKEICGVGYRKALEFLIKDFLILNDESEKGKIEKMSLGNCIGTYVEDARIKAVAKRAVWLGNDETHYVRKWNDKDMQDLKKLIELTVHWIEMEKLTESFETEMPE